MNGFLAFISITALLIVMGFFVLVATINTKHYTAEINLKELACEEVGGVFEQRPTPQCWSLETGTRLFPWIKR